jgi:hypothetical protein
MYCPACQSPIAAVKNGHAVRNTLGAATTAGLALKSERWRCPNCGGLAYSARTGPKTTAEAQRGEAGVALGMAAGVIVGIAAQSVVVGVIALLLLGIAGGAWGQMKGATSGEGRPAGQWRCEKNDHLLSAKFSTCPIDKSPVRQI